jgi:hypothetical protein
MVCEMAIISVAEARKILKKTGLTDKEITELIEFIEEIAWQLLEKNDQRNLL